MKFESWSLIDIFYMEFIDEIGKIVRDVIVAYIIVINEIDGFLVM